MSLQIGNKIALFHPHDNTSSASHFLVEDVDGDMAYHVHCLNGSWNGVYDPDMQMLEIDAPSGKRYMVCTHEVIG